MWEKGYPDLVVSGGGEKIVIELKAINGEVGAAVKSSN